MSTENVRLVSRMTHSAQQAGAVIHINTTKDDAPTLTGKAVSGFTVSHLHENGDTGTGPLS